MADSDAGDDTDIDFNEGVWQHVIDPDDFVVDGVLYDGRQWESDGEGGVRERLCGDARIQRDEEEADLDTGLWESRQKALEEDAELDCASDMDAE